MFTKIAAPFFGLTVLATPVGARDDGRYANSPLKPWFESLQSEFGQCCTNADAYIVLDADWESDRGHYRVRIDGEWVMVPDGAVLRSRIAPARLWYGSTTSMATRASAASCPGV